MEEFTALVAKDVRNECSDTEMDKLESDLRGWKNELHHLMRDVDVQLAAQKARMSRKRAELMDPDKLGEWLEFKANEDKWRVGAMRFKVSVEDRMLYVKTLMAEKNTKTQTA